MLNQLIECLNRDLEKPNAAVYSAQAHTSIINDIDGCGGLNIGKGAAELATCSRDGSVKIWDVRQKDRPVAVIEPEEGASRKDCWAVAFGIIYQMILAIDMQLSKL